MGYNSLLRSPKKEEQEVPDSTDSAHRFVVIKEQPRSYADGGGIDIDIMDELEGIGRVHNNNEDKDYQKSATDHSSRSQLTWDFMDMDWEGFANNNGDEEEDDEREQLQIEFTRNFLQHQDIDHEKKIINIKGVKKKEGLGFWDENAENRASLNLNLNYQQVLDAWSDRGPLWADDFSLSSRPSHGYYMGEVPVMEEDKTRREASVLRYKEKRQSRLFSKKIRYQVRKLNADKRPRLKGRFVKRFDDHEKI